MKKRPKWSRQLSSLKARDNRTKFCGLSGYADKDENGFKPVVINHTAHRISTRASYYRRHEVNKAKARERYYKAK
jgi:hypothetical protein